MRDDQRQGLARAAVLDAVVARRTTAQAPGALANVLTFGWRALLKIKHMPEQLFDVVVTPIMFTLMFTYLFGGALAGSPTAYLQFLLPGIVAQTVLFTSVYTGITLNGDISKGIFDRFRSMPMWRPAPIAGALAGDSVRYAISSGIVVLIGFIIGFRPEGGMVGVVLGILLLMVFALGMGWIFTTIGLLVRTPATVMTLSWLVLMPLTFASNIYVDPATMPGWLQAVVAVNPVTLAVTAARGVMAGTAGLGDIGLALLAPAVVTALCAPLTMALYSRER